MLKRLYARVRQRMSWTFGLTSKGVIHWRGLTFYFEAPYKLFEKAKHHGVENQICQLARNTLQAGGSAVDVGANYGFVTLVMASVVQPNSRIVAIELDPVIVRHLAKTIARNGFESRCTVIARGAGAADEIGMVTVDDVVRVQQITNVAFIKIDTDGNDFNVLRGATQVLRAHHPTVVIEMQHDQDVIYRFLQDLGYSFFTDQSGTPIALGQPCANLVASTAPIARPP